MSNFIADFQPAAAPAPATPNGTCLPNGSYVVRCIEAKETLTRRAREEGDPAIGTMVSCCFEVADGEHFGRKVWANFNLVNRDHKQAEEIGRHQLKCFMEAIGKPEGVKSCDELCDIPLVIKTKVKSSEQYGDRAEVRGYYAVERRVDTTTGPALQMPHNKVDPQAASDAAKTRVVRKVVKRPF